VIHHAELVDDGPSLDVVGLSGLSFLTAPFRIRFGGHLSLCGPKLTRNISAKGVPGLARLAECDTIKEALSLKGTGEKQVKDFTTESILSVMEPPDMKFYKGGSLAKAEEVLWAVIVHTKYNWKNKSDKKNREFRNKWEPIAQRLWVISNGWANPTYFDEP